MCIYGYVICKNPIKLDIWDGSVDIKLKINKGDKLLITTYIKPTGLIGLYPNNNNLNFFATQELCCFNEYRSYFTEHWDFQ